MAYHSFVTVILPALFALGATFFAIKFLMPYFNSAGIVAEDRNKEKMRRLTGSGGVAVAFGITIGILAYTFGASFLFSPAISVPDILAASLSIVLIAAVGFIDDINVKSRRVQVTGMKGINKGLKQWQKPILTIIGAMPLIAINVGVSTIHLPFLGAVNFGLLFPLVIIPLMVVFAANAYNLLGGFNGLEASTGLIAGIGFVIYFYLFGNAIGLMLSSLLVGALIAFLIFNWYPAKILPGDSFTYCVGGAMVAIMIMGHAEAFGFIVFMPWIIEFLLHLRGKFRVTDLGIRQRDGSLKAPYGSRIYSLTHLAMNLRKKAKEREVTIMLALFEAAFVAIAFIVVLYGIL
jgi:UDP-N-acetylglucosamine--dolichyl-phosphate N-acetylglucosaminephosphotransferase